MNKKKPLPQEPLPEPGLPTDPAYLKFASQLRGQPSTHDCRALGCSGGLHHCQNPACDRQVIMTHQYCCGACEHGCLRETTVHPHGAPGVHYTDAHSQLCESRHAEYIKPGS